MRVLVVTNFMPDEHTPQRGRWVFDQVDELRSLGIETDVFTFPMGKGEYLPATRRLRTLLRERSFDLVHAHYGLAGWCAKLAGARPLVVTYHGTDVRHRAVGPLSRLLARRIELPAGVSRSLFETAAGRPGLPRTEGAAVLPCGPDLDRFGPLPRAEARRELGLAPDGRYLIFPANPARPEKRHDLALRVAEECGAKLLTGGGIEPERMNLWLNAASAVLVTSDYEGFGLICLEALASEVPVLSTPVGIAPLALAGLDGSLCAGFDLGAWSAAARRHLDDPDPRVRGRSRAAAFSARRMAQRVAIAYREVLGHDSV